MQVTLLTVDDTRWVSVLSESTYDFYDLPGYVDLCAKEDGGEARALLVEDGRDRLLLPLIFRDICEGRGMDATSPYGYPGLIWVGHGDPAFLRSSLIAGVEALRAAGIVSVFVRLHPLLNPRPPETSGMIIVHGETVSIDLTLSPERLWADTRGSHRREIERAVRLGYVARIDGTWEHLKDFKRLYRQTMTRRHAAPGFFFGNHYFERLRAALGDRLHLAVVEKDGAIAAAGLFVESGGIVQYHLSGTDESFAKVQPTKLMIHFVRGWARERGDLTMHLGGGVGGLNNSLLQFKAGFAPRRHPYRTIRIVVDEARYRQLVQDHDPSLDPADLAGFFPLYRSTASSEPQRER